jgi:hypothetical protein
MKEFKYTIGGIAILALSFYSLFSWGAYLPPTTGISKIALVFALCAPGCAGIVLIALGVVFWKYPLSKIAMYLPAKPPHMKTKFFLLFWLILTIGMSLYIILEDWFFG